MYWRLPSKKTLAYAACPLNRVTPWTVNAQTRIIGRVRLYGYSANLGRPASRRWWRGCVPTPRGARHPTSTWHPDAAASSKQRVQRSGFGRVSPEAPIAAVVSSHPRRQAAGARVVPLMPGIRGKGTRPIVGALRARRRPWARALAPIYGSRGKRRKPQSCCRPESPRPTIAPWRFMPTADSKVHSDASGRYAFKS